jgi:hypothetical protein
MGPSPVARSSRSTGGGDRGARVGVGLGDPCPPWCPPVSPTSGASGVRAVTGGYAKPVIAIRPSESENEQLEGGSVWRRRAELNRGTRICNPLPSHSATAPRRGRSIAARRGGAKPSPRGGRGSGGGPAGVRDQRRGVLTVRAQAVTAAPSCAGDIPRRRSVSPGLNFPAWRSRTHWRSVARCLPPSAFQR